MFYSFVLLTIIGFSLSAIQLIPFLELLNYSIRGVGTDYNFIVDMSFPIEHLITLIMPEFFGTPLDNTYWGSNYFWELSAYIGVIPLILSIFAVFFKRNKYVIFFAFLALLSLFFALGKYNPFFSFFYDTIPLFSMFRGPGRIIFLYVFSMATLSGFGYDFLTEKFKKYEKKNIIVIAKIFFVLSILIAASIGIFVLNRDFILSVGESIGIEKIKERASNNPSIAGYYLENIKDITANVYDHIFNGSFIVLFSLAAITATIVLKLRRIINIKLLKILFIALILFDLWFYGTKYIDVKEQWKNFDKTKTIDFLLNDKEMYRVLLINESVRFAELNRYGIELVGFYDQLGLKRYSQFLAGIEDVQEEMFTTINKIKHQKLIDLLNIKYVIGTEEMNEKSYEMKLKDKAKFIKHNVEYYQDVYVYENKNYLPRAFVVHKAKIIKDKEDVLNELKSEEFNPREYIVLENDINEKFLNNSEVFQEAEIMFYSPNRIIIKTNITASGFLLLADNWYPGWKAYDNGKEKEIYKTNYILRSVFLEHGEHLVEFVYNPSSFRVGSIITALTILILCVIIIRHRKLFSI